jgi:altronate hydrolase
LSTRVLLIHPQDNVAVAVQPLTRGETVAVAGRKIILKDSVPAGHKVALRSLAQGEDVIKYGHRIGLASAPVNQGSWVHTHNLKTALSGVETYEYRPEAHERAAPAIDRLTFQGFRRASGGVGTRNEIWIIPSVGCVNKTAERLAALAGERLGRENFDGVYAFSHPCGCSQAGDDEENTKRLLASLMCHPNAGGVLALGLGCETNQLEDLLAGAAGLDVARVRSLPAQAVTDEIKTGLRLLDELFAATAADRRTEVPASELVLGLKCGGSDAFSGITANAVLGRIADWAAARGGTVLLSEVPEMFGAEKLLMNRARDREIFDRLVRLIDGFKRYYLDHGRPVDENPSPGNIAGGITTLEEKSLGAVQKGGRAAVTQVLDYGARATERGLVLVGAPGNDAVSSTAITAAGATLLLFTTGCGTPFGAPVPTIKISSNSPLFRTKPHWIDFDAGRIADMEQPENEIMLDLVRLIIDVASGKKKTNNEIRGHREIALWKTGVTL